MTTTTKNGATVMEMDDFTYVLLYIMYLTGL